MDAENGPFLVWQHDALPAVFQGITDSNLIIDRPVGCLADVGDVDESTVERVNDAAVHFSRWP